jgi:hypothetical protein
MTEIQVFPAGAPPVPLDEPGDSLEQILASLHVSIGRLANRLPDPQHMLSNEAQALYPVRIDPIPIPPVAPGSTTGLLDMPQMLRPLLGQNWDIHTISATGIAASAGTTASGTIAAGAGSAALPAGASLNSFNVTFSVAPTTAGTLTLTNGLGGTEVYNVAVGQTSLTVPFSPALAAATSGSAITLTAAGLGGTAAGTIILQGATAAGVVQGWINQPSNTSGGAQRFNQTGPGYQNYGKGQLWLRGNGDRLVFTATGMTPGVSPVVSIDATRVADLYVGRYFL